MITRSSKQRLNHTNTGKKDQLFFLLNDYVSRMMSRKIMELVYSGENIPAFLPKEFTDTIPVDGSHNRQMLGCEISSCARSIRSKLKKAETIEAKKKYQEELLEKFQNKTLKVKWNGNLNLDGRFVSIEDNKESVDFPLWLSVKFFGKDKFYIPLKKTRHMENLESRGFTLKRNSLKICRNGRIILFYNKEEPKSTGTETVGIDVGRNKAFVTSRGETEGFQKELLAGLKKKKHGSKNKSRLVRRIKHALDKSAKDDIDYSNLETVVLEKLTGMKVGHKWGNTNHHWSYRYIQNRIGLMCEERGVRVKHVRPAYTSQTCSKCGHRHKENRNGERFVCLSCGMEMDADLNAAINIRKQGSNSPHGQ